MEVPKQASIWHSSAELHPTHHLAWYMGLIIWCKCGYYGSGKVVRFIQECQVRPPNAVQKVRLRRLLQGKVPFKNVIWPKPAEAECPGGLTMWLS